MEAIVVDEEGFPDADLIPVCLVLYLHKEPATSQGYVVCKQATLDSEGDSRGAALDEERQTPSSTKGLVVCLVRHNVGLVVVQDTAHVGRVIMETAFGQGVGYSMEWDQGVWHIPAGVGQAAPGQH